MLLQEKSKIAAKMGGYRIELYHSMIQIIDKMPSLKNAFFFKKNRQNSCQFRKKQYLCTAIE